MAQSTSGESDLVSILTDSFVEKPKPPPQPQRESQPRPKSTPSQRQDELVRKFPGSKIIRRPNPMEEADDSIYIRFPHNDCGNYMQRFFEAARLYGKDCTINDYSCVFQRIIRKECGIEVQYPAAQPLPQPQPTSQSKPPPLQPEPQPAAASQSKRWWQTLTLSQPESQLKPQPQPLQPEPEPQPAAASQSKRWWQPSPLPQPESQLKPQPQPQPESQPKPPTQPKEISGSATRRQDALIKKYPGSKINRRPRNPNSKIFPSDLCEHFMEHFYEQMTGHAADTRKYKRWVRDDCGIEVYNPDSYSSKARDMIERVLNW